MSSIERQETRAREKELGARGKGQQVRKRQGTRDDEEMARGASRANL